MKITIRTNPEIIIEVDQDKTSAVLPIMTGIYVPPIAPAREPKADPKPEPKLGGKNGNHKTRLCSNCNQPGHKKPTCPNEKKKDKKDSDPFDDDLAEKIQGLRDEGFSSQYNVWDTLPTRAFGSQAFYSCFSKLRRCGAGYKKTKRARSRRDSESRNLDVVGFSPQLSFCAITSGQQILTNQEIDNVRSGRVRSSSMRRAE